MLEFKRWIWTGHTSHHVPPASQSVHGWSGGQRVTDGGQSCGDSLSQDLGEG